MTRGNQRDKAREKALKSGKQPAKASEQAGNKGLSFEDRKQRDADIMRQKQEKKKADKEAGEAQGASGGAQGASGGASSSKKK